VITQLDDDGQKFMVAYLTHIIHRLGKVNRDVNGLIWNPSSNEEDTIRVHCHGDVDLEVIPRWHASTYLCTLLGCFGYVP
jgi:hypothetical protein